MIEGIPSHQSTGITAHFRKINELVDAVNRLTAPTPGPCCAHCGTEERFAGIIEIAATGGKNG